MRKAAMRKNGSTGCGVTVLCMAVVAGVMAMLSLTARGDILSGGLPDTTWSNNAVQIWFKADDGALTNASGHVTTWLDRSSHIRSATVSQGDGPLVVANQLNGKPVARFSSDLLATVSSAMNSDEAHVFIVMKMFTSTYYDCLLCYGAGGDGAWNLIMPENLGYVVMWGKPGNVGPVSTVDLRTVGYSILEGSVTADDVWRLWIGGSIVAGPTNGAFTQAASLPFTIGGRSDNPYYPLDGDIAERLTLSRHVGQETPLKRSG